MRQELSKRRVSIVRWRSEFPLSLFRGLWRWRRGRRESSSNFRVQSGYESWHHRSTPDDQDARRHGLPKVDWNLNGIHEISLRIISGRQKE